MDKSTPEPLDVALDVNTMEEPVFKKPQLPIKRHSESEPKVNTAEHQQTQQNTTNNNITEEKSKINEKDLSQLSTEGNSRTDSDCSGYRAPEWSGDPPAGYSLETLRLGAIVERRDVGACTVFGRFTDCHVVLQHPSISRHHAALVYRCQSSDSGSPAGFYLCDLNSTHGTLVNKQPIQPSVYSRLRVGHMFKLGGSTRLFILQGPAVDEELESAMTVTEIKQEAEQRKLKQQLRMSDREDRDRTEVSSRGAEDEDPRDVEKDGIDWGMGEDASESADLTYNPYAMGDADNSHLYLDDPKRTLRGWFEREGYELEYHTETVANGKHVCRIELPVEGRDGERLVAEVQHVGKKRDAVLQCAMQACRLLDMAGLLRQATHESRAGRKRRCSDDDSDDDNDTFLDRTGAVEKRRQRKLVTSGGGDEKQPETHQSLTEKYIALQKEIAQLQSKLDSLCESEKIDQTGDSGGGECDALDTYMKSLNTLTGSAARQEQRKIKKMLSSLLADSKRIHRLVQLTRPASLPPLAPSIPPASSTSAVVASASKAKPAVMVGKRKGGIHSRRLVTPASVASSSCAPSDTTASVASPSCALSNSADSLSRETSANDSSATDTPEPGVTDADRCVGPRLTDSTPGHSASSDSGQAATAARLGHPGTTTDVYRSDKSTGTVSRQPDKMAAVSRDQQLESAGIEDSSRHSMWLPPPGQTGDGRTSLNDKLGY